MEPTLRVDRYTKAVLTIIAVCLIYLCLAVTRWPAVSAQSGSDVVITGWRDAQGNGYRLPPTSGSTAPLPTD